MTEEQHPNENQAGRPMLTYPISDDTPLGQCKRCRQDVYRVATGQGYAQADANGQPHTCPELKRVYPIPPRARWRPCKAEECRARIAWSEYKKGDETKHMPIDPDGGSHFETCLKVRDFSGRNRQQ